jgi:hypothetical protein
MFISFISCCLGFTSPIIVRRQLGDQEWKFLGHIDADEKLLREIGVTIGIKEDDFDDITRAAQGGGMRLPTA